MKNQVFLLSIMLTALTSCPLQEGDDCHYSIKIRNNSNNEVVFGTRAISGSGKCRLDGVLLSKGELYEYQPFNFCIENSLNGQPPLTLYMVDPLMYNDPNILYSCDSIEVKNKILKTYVLEVEDLKILNFEVNYQ